MSFSILSVQSWTDGDVVLYDDGNYYYIDNCDNEESYVLIGPVEYDSTTTSQLVW